MLHWVLHCNSKIYLPLDLLRDLQCPLHYRWWGYAEHSSLWSFVHIAFIFHLVGPPIAVPSSYFGTATGPILLSGVQCNGSELQLTSCPKASSALISFCNHGFDVGVICHGEFGTLCILTLQRCTENRYMHKISCMLPKQQTNQPTNKPTNKQTNKQKLCGCCTKLPMTDGEKCPPVWIQRRYTWMMEQYIISNLVSGLLPSFSVAIK